MRDAYRHFYPFLWVLLPILIKRYRIKLKKRQNRKSSGLVCCGPVLAGFVLAEFGIFGDGKFYKGVRAAKVEFFANV